MTEAMQWPPDYAEEIRRRLAWFKELRAIRDSELERFQTIMHHYRNDPVSFIQDFCVTFDPRKRDPEIKVMPFMLFPRQVDFVNFLHELYTARESGLTEKARDIGASWICCAFSVWLWRFHSDSSIGWGSRKEEYVDKKGDPKAIFPKIRQIIDFLPGFMKPAGYDEAKHATYMKIINPENGSTIIGEAGDNIGRGGRTTIFFKDESAHYEHPDLIEAALGDNTDVQVDISSVNGTANVFYRRRMAGEIWEPGHSIPSGKTRVFIFDWRHHPGKTQEWYDRRKKKAEDEGLAHMFAQEVDRDYAGAVQGVIIPSLWVRAAIDAHIKLGFEPSGAKVAAQDVADGGGDKNSFIARHGVVCNFAEAWGGEAGDAAQIAVDYCKELDISELYYDSIGVGVGFKVGINQLKERPSYPKRLRVYPWDAGAEVLDPEDNVIPGDPESPLNKDEYLNLKAQSWFRTRARFYKTYKAVTFGEKFPPDQLISISSKIPKVEQLIIELSQPVRKANGEGKTMVDKKPDGATSPNLADGFVACYNPAKEVTIFDVL